DFQPATEKSVDELLTAIQTQLGLIANPHLDQLVRHFYEDPEFLRQFTSAPASRRVHHAYLGRLLEHTAEVLQLCTSVLALYPEIDGDLLRTGALLHGLGQVQAFSWDDEIEYTDAGQLIGQTNISDDMVAAAIRGLPDFPEELAWRVRHMILSHLGRPE